MAPDVAVVWSDVCAVVEHRLGLHFPPGRLADLKRGLRGAAAELGLRDEDECAHRLLSAGLEASSLDVIVSYLTIGETYFLRGEETFAALTNRLLPELIAARRRAGDLRLRFWSAACCTGEEVYSLALVLKSLLPDVEQWRITLLGTDINPRFLEKARTAVYNQWSFRGTSTDFRKLYFERLPGGRYRVLPDIRKMVTFEQMNLVEASQQPRGDLFDVIFCRNVLMYFTSVQAARVIECLHARLHPQGWLAVAPCEASHTLFSQFDSVHCEGAILYRPAGQPRVRVANEARAPVAVAVPTPRLSVPSRKPEVVTATTMQMASEIPPSAAVSAAHARALADQRRMREALSWCDRWIRADRVDPAAHYLRGLILTELGDGGAATAAFERSLYLAPDHAMACFALANVERQRGRRRQASRHYAHLLELLGRLAPDAPVEYAEGVTARQLTTLTRDFLASLKESA